MANPPPMGAPHQQPAGSNPFAAKPAAPTGPDPQVMSQLSNVTRRLRIVEETVSNIRKKTNLDEENTLEELKKLHSNTKTLFSEIDGMKKEIEAFKEEMRKMIREFQNVAKKDDVEVLKKYIQLWEPVQFATVKQVAHMIDEAQTHGSVQQPSFEPVMPSTAELQPEPTQVEETTVGEKEEVETPQTQSKIEEITETKEGIFSPHKNNVMSEYTKMTPPANPNSLDTSAEDQSAETTVSSEQKKQIALLIETYEDIRNMLLEQPDAFVEKIESDPQLSKLFHGVNIHELSAKLKPHYQ